MIGIKDFTMPKNCGECRCYDVEWARCSFLDKDTEGFDKRPTDCPLVEDVKTVVRCKDCKWVSRDCEWCLNPDAPVCGDDATRLYIEPNWFCADGKRKEEENDKRRSGKDIE